jgi:hypothetical protein
MLLAYRSAARDVMFQNRPGNEALADANGVLWFAKACNTRSARFLCLQERGKLCLCSFARMKEPMINEEVVQS